MSRKVGLSLIKDLALTHISIGLPRAASWAQKPFSSSSGSGLTPSSSSSLSRPPRRGGTARQPRTGTGQVSEIRAAQTRSGVERKSVAASFSRSSTPPFGDGKSYRKETMIPKSTNSPAPSVNAESDAGSHPQEQGLPLSSRPSSPGSSWSPMRSIAQVATSAPAVPPGLSAPPGIRSPAHPSRVPTASPQTPLLSLQSSYQMSTAARALLDDVKARREASQPAFGLSPFPDFDRTLQALGGGDDGGFSFNLDPKLADEVETSGQLDGFNPDTAIPFASPYVDGFPILHTSSATNSPHLGPPPGLSYPANRSVFDSFIIKTDLDVQSGHSYMGSFNPFADSSEDDIHGLAPRSNTEVEEERKHSRFNFARGRHGSNLTSPSNTSGPNFNHIPENSAFYSTPIGVQPPGWSSISHQEFNYPQVASNVASPLLQQSQSQNLYPQNVPRFQPFETDLSEAQLRDFIQSSRERANVNVNNLHSDHQVQGNQSVNVFAMVHLTPFSDPPGLHKVQQPFHDPAIMSASFAPSQAPMNITYGPPPGLTFPPGVNSDDGPTVNSHVSPIPPLDEGSTHGESNISFLQGREVNVPNVSLPHYGNPAIGVNALFNTLVAQTQ
jgi:CCR4-NOT transcription complex subunit 4